MYKFWGCDDFQFSSSPVDSSSFSSFKNWMKLVQDLRATPGKISIKNEENSVKNFNFFSHLFPPARGDRCRPSTSKNLPWTAQSCRTASWALLEGSHWDVRVRRLSAWSSAVLELRVQVSCHRIALAAGWAFPASACWRWSLRGFLRCTRPGLFRWGSGWSRSRRSFWWCSVGVFN